MFNNNNQYTQPATTHKLHMQQQANCKPQKSKPTTQTQQIKREATCNHQQQTTTTNYPQQQPLGFTDPKVINQAMQKYLRYPLK